MSLDELPLNRPTLASPVQLPPERPSAVRWVAVGSAAFVATAALTFWWMSRTQPTPIAPPSVTATDVAAGSNRPKRQPLDLPDLGQSDALLRSLVGTLSQHPTLARLLATPGLVRGATLTVVQIADGRTPERPLRVLRPAQRLMVMTVPGESSARIDPASYARWDIVATALTSVSPVDAAQVYVNIKPLVDEAYIEIGNPDGAFDVTLVRAIRLLADTPLTGPDPVLLKRPGYIDHEDPALRALRPVQKQFLLLGPENRRRVLVWLRQFAGNLDLKID